MDGDRERRQGFSQAGVNGIESKSGDGVAISPVTVGGISSSGGEVAGGDLVGKCENYGKK